jgi:hypothetical protein
MGWSRRHHRKPDPEQVRRAWWVHAVNTYTTLAAGGQPASWEPEDLRFTSPVFLDASVEFACFYGLDVVQPDPVWCLVPPNILGAWLCARLAAAQADRNWQRALERAAPQWRDHAPARVLVTAEATWVRVHGAWQAYPHAAIVDYRLDGDAAVFTAAATAPRALAGPPAWVHAVLLAYLHPALGDWRAAPWLAPIRDATRP